VAAAPHDIDPADVPVVILAGGQGMRLREETERVPKPMVRIGEQPILWHIMRHYGVHGFRRFVICLGYKGWAIKEYFLNYAEELSDVRVGLASGEVALLRSRPVEDWEVTMADTGLDAGTTGRLAAVRRYVDAPVFMCTYGDGVATVDLTATLQQHLAGPQAVTLTAVKPMSRFGVLVHDGDRVTTFAEKPEIAEGYVNGGFFVMDADVFDRLEAEPPEGFIEGALLPELAAEGRLAMHAHHGFWHSMDTYRDFTHLNELWASGQAPWRTW
jgi:glucose-1-phosphate cytidylyltransferase